MIYELEPFLDAYDIPFNPTKRGNQMISCPNPEHDDSHPSTSVHLDKGLWNCQACGEGGSAVDLVMTIEGVDLREALARAEAMASGDSREIPSGAGRNSVGLPRKPGGQRGTGKPVPAWRGFRS